MLPIGDEADVPRFDRKTDADRHFMRLAMILRAESDDPKAQFVALSGVGALIVGRNGILAQSANVLPPSLKAHHLTLGHSISEEERYFFLEHAERAVIFKGLMAGKDLAGSTLYCTRHPCSDCARAIVWAGIRRGVFASGYGAEGRWLQSQRAARHILRNAGVVVRILGAPTPP